MAIVSTEYEKPGHQSGNTADMELKCIHIKTFTQIIQYSGQISVVEWMWNMESKQKQQHEVYIC